jgi:hypothetical protein
MRLVFALAAASAGAAADTLQVPGQYPFIQAAIDAAADGDTIALAAGSYWNKGENLALDVHGKQLTLLGVDGADKCILDGSPSFPTPFATLGAAEAGGITLRGLTITHCKQDAGGALLVENGAQLLAEDCRFVGNSGKKGGGAVAVRQGSSATFRRCLFVFNDSHHGGAIQASASAVVVEHCTFVGNGLLSSISEGGALLAEAQGSFVVSDSILRDDIATFGPTIAVKGAGSQVSVKSSDVDGGAAKVGLLDGGVLSWGAGNIDADPLFKQPQFGNYHLLGGSPCIDSGDPLGPPDADGTPPDMGALVFAPWTPYGEAILGFPGPLTLTGAGTLKPGDPMSVTLHGTQPGQPFLLLVGVEPGPALFQGKPCEVYPVLLVASVTGVDGAGTFAAIWPLAMQSGSIVYLQAWAPGAVYGWLAASSSNGLGAETR